MKRCRARLAGALVAVATLLVCAPPANAAIVPFKSIAGIEPGMKGSDVRAKLGEPSSVREGPLVGARSLIYGRHKLEFTVTANEEETVGAIITRSRAQRTPDDLGVGTKLRRLRSKLRRELCNELSRYTNCTVYSRGMAMTFIVKRGRVTEVWLGKSAAPS
jgi:hypothetical protein